MSNLTERQLLVLTIAVSVLLTGGLLFFVYGDRSDIAVIEEDIAALDARLTIAEIEKRKIPGLEDKILQFRAVEDDELAVLPSKQRISDFHRNISTFLSAAGISFLRLPESSPEDSELAKGIRVTRNRIKGRGEASEILKFMNMIENDPRLISIKGFKMDGGDTRRDGDPDAPIRHDFELALETYFYGGQAAIKHEHIPGAERRLNDPKLRIAIESFQPERQDTYVLRPAAGRRDPLVDPRRKREVIDPVLREQQFRKEEKTVVDLEGGYRVISELLEQEKALEADGDLFRLDRLRRKIQEQINELRANLEHVLHTKGVQIPELQARVEVIAENLNSVRGTRSPRELVVTRTVAENVLSELDALRAKGAFDEVVTLAGSWTSFLRGKKIMPEASAVVTEINELRKQAKILGEFAGISINISGGIVDEKSPEDSIAVVNGRGMQIGDRLDEKGEITVQKIESGAVWFVYKGVSVRRPRGQSGSSEDE